jgi:hypothetical protein
MGREIEKILGGVDQSRRDFLRKVIGGAAFAPPLIASFSLDGLSLTTADAQVQVTNQTCNISNQTLPALVFDFSGTQYQDNFRDILRGTDINAGLDLAGGHHSALNITGSANAAGSTWMTVLDIDPLTPDEDLLFDFRRGLRLSADVLIHRFNNTKGVGLLAGLNEGSTDKGLALILWNAGNSDVLQLFTVDQAGKLTSLTSRGLGAGIAENAWYSLEMEIGFPRGQFTVMGAVSRHHTPGDPDSDIQTQVGSLVFQGPIPAGVNSGTGEVGIIARAISAAVDSSVTNFVVGECSPTIRVPAPV